MKLTRSAWARFGMATCHDRRDGAVTLVTLSDENLLSGQRTNPLMIILLRAETASASEYTEAAGEARRHRPY